MIAAADAVEATDGGRYAKSLTLSFDFLFESERVGAMYFTSMSYGRREYELPFVHYRSGMIIAIVDYYNSKQERFGIAPYTLLARGIAELDESHRSKSIKTSLHHNQT